MSRQAGEPAHALLSASSSHRWLSCPPSARLSQNYEDRESDYAAEGTAAHLLCEYKLKIALGLRAKDPTPDLTYYDQEMEECAVGYVAYILELIEKAKESCADPIVLIEQRLDYSRYAQDGFGTGDCVIAGEGVLYIVDYKHGQGVLVEAERNPQMMLYGLGALEIFDCLFDIGTVSMTIYQPRRNNISTYTTAKEDLYRWGREELKPKAELAYSGGGEFLCGEWCQFCKAKHECRARAEHNMALAQYDFKLPPLLEDSEVENVLSKIGLLISWANDIKAYALQAALGGKEWKGWKLVEGRSIRKYKNEDAVAKVVYAAGYDPYEKRLKGITAMEKSLGKTRFSELLGNFVEKPPGKPTLVPADDKRPAINTAKQDFEEEI
jgi:hypothetical protein